jgi:hypothetical protein
VITVVVFLVGNVKSNTEKFTDDVLQFDGVERTAATVGYEDPF